MIASGLTGISRLIKENEDVVTERITKKWEDDIRKRRESSPVVSWGAPYDGLESTLDIGYGFLNGMVDVFPATSLPQRCRSNTTTIYYAIKNLFIDPIFVLPAEDVEFTYEI